MSSTTPPETTESILPSHELRHELSSRLAALATTITADPRMQIPNNLHPTLVKLWDYATRADYILSELDNIEAGGALRFPQQIPDYQAETPNPDKAAELLNDIIGRCTRFERVTPDLNLAIMAAIHPMSEMDWGEEIREKAGEVWDAATTLNRLWGYAIEQN